MVLFPAPVWPTTATTSPGWMTKFEIFQSRTGGQLASLLAVRYGLVGE